MKGYLAGSYDAVVIGAGHAGCEAGLALSRIGYRTLILTINLNSVAVLACNPSIGGTAKGHIVREVDALGGEMGINADACLLQLRMLNLAKGPAVHSLRGQADKTAYHIRMKRILENTERLNLVQGEAVEILTECGKTAGIRCADGAIYRARAVVLATGVYLKSDVIMGEYRVSSGPAGFFPANGLTKSLLDLGFAVRRFKTGTPARLDRRSIDFSRMEEQHSDEQAYPFSFLTDSLSFREHACWLTYTNERTHEIIRKNLDRAPMYNGMIQGIGPRYCPSIEAKVVRFAEKERHQVFIEPEGAATNEMYAQGLSTSLPPDVQLEMYRTVTGLEKVSIMRYAYAIEYDCLDPMQLYPTLQTKEVGGLFAAGQINGSSGYEEAAGQGILAGINAAQYLKGEEPVVLSRAQAYIGVLVDDLVTKGTEEPYRMMTARAEYRLHLRQDNADQRLTELGRRVGLVDDERYRRYCDKLEKVERLKRELGEKLASGVVREIAKEKPELGSGPVATGAELLKKNGIEIGDFVKNHVLKQEYPQDVLRQAEIEIKYEGYLVQQQQEIKRSEKWEDTRLPADLAYENLPGIREEARQKLAAVRPVNLGQASRISGVSPADISVLILSLKLRREGKT